MPKLNKVVIPIAGLGTRMLPATKAIPKEMLPVVNKPIIQYIVEEAVSAGFKEIIFVTHSSKYSVENHFDTSFELEATLEKRVKRALLKEIKSISKLNIFVSSIRQGEAKGLGHAILSARSVVGKNPFAVILPDMLIKDNNKLNNLNLMKKTFEKEGLSSILIGEALKKDLSKYGIVDLEKKNGSPVLIKKIIEKPSQSKAPSKFFAAGRYIFNNSIFSYLDEVKEDASGELQLTDAISDYLSAGKKILAFKTNGKIYDCGEKIGYLKAILDYSFEDKNLKKDLLKHIKNLSHKS